MRRFLQRLVQRNSGAYSTSIAEDQQTKILGKGETAHLSTTHSANHQHSFEQDPVLVEGSTTEDRTGEELGKEEDSHSSSSSSSSLNSYSSSDSGRISEQPETVRPFLANFTPVCMAADTPYMSFQQLKSCPNQLFFEQIIHTISINTVLTQQAATVRTSESVCVCVCVRV